MRCISQHNQWNILIKILINLVWCALISSCYRTSFAQAFDYLSTLQIKGYFTYTIRFESTLTTVLNERIDEEYGGNLTVKAILTRLSSASKEKYIVVFSEGASVDPFFVIHHINEKHGIDSTFKIYAMINDEKRAIGGIKGLELIIPGNNSVYVSGHTNNMFNMRRKFLLKDNRLEEIRQPFYYVGLKSETLQPVELYSDTSHEIKVAHLPAGYQVEVLVNKGDDYLLKTPFGLTGWIRIPFGTFAERTPIKGIYFAGD